MRPHQTNPENLNLRLNKDYNAENTTIIDTDCDCSIKDTAVDLSLKNLANTWQNVISNSLVQSITNLVSAADMDFRNSVMAKNQNHGSPQNEVFIEGFRPLTNKGEMVGSMEENDFSLESCSSCDKKKSTDESDAEKKFVKHKRGRKPGAVSSDSKFRKRVEKRGDKEIQVVCFGNSRVVEGSPEYIERRKRNNEAVKRRRQKEREDHEKFVNHLEKLKGENDKLKTSLTETNRLQDEVDTLKNQVETMSRQLLELKSFLLYRFL